MMDRDQAAERDTEAHCLGVRRVVETIEPQKPLLDRQQRFDLVTALWIKFNSLPSRQGRPSYWTVDDWLFLCRDLIESHMRLPGTIHLELNRQYEIEQDRAGHYDAELLEMFKMLGATVDEERGVITLYCPA